MNGKLTKKQELFCKEYLCDLNATQAAIRAGYSEDTAGSIGHENLKKLEIQEEIQRLFDQRAKKVQITADKVLSNIIEIGDRCMQKKPVMYYDKVEKEYVQETVAYKDDEGNIREEGVWEFDSRGALKAQELLGKHLKLFGSRRKF